MKNIKNRLVVPLALTTIASSYTSDKDNFNDPSCLSCKNKPMSSTKKSNKTQKSTHDIAKTIHNNQSSTNNVNETRNTDKNDVRKTITNNKPKKLQNSNNIQEYNNLNLPLEDFNESLRYSASFNDINSYEDYNLFDDDDIFNLHRNYDWLQDDSSLNYFDNSIQRYNDFQDYNSHNINDIDILTQTKNNKQIKGEMFTISRLLDKKRGRKPLTNTNLSSSEPKTPNNTKTHDRKTNDNCIIKIKTRVLKIVREFINKKIREAYDLEDNSKEVIQPINPKYYIQNRYDSIFIHKPMKKIFSGDICLNTKYKLDFNKVLIEKLEKDNKLEITRLLNKTFIEYLKYFTGKSNSKELNEMVTIDECLEKISKGDAEYAKHLKYVAENFENIIKKIKRRPGGKNSKSNEELEALGFNTIN